MAAIIDERGSAANAATDEANVWVDIARSYAAFSCPFVPSMQDIGLYEAAARHHAGQLRRNRFDVLMLGVTPGIANMGWPDGSRVLAVEISPTVIGAIWPGDIAGFRQACCASWFDVPASPGSVDMVVGDGSLNACRYPRGIRSMFEAMSTLLRPGGMIAVRTYARPDVPEPVCAVFDALQGAAKLEVDEFKLRLFLAMQRSAREGVAVCEAARMLEAFGVDGRVMKEQLGWNDAATKPFERWRTSDVVYSFPTLAELRALFRDLFEEVSVVFPSYSMGHCCPVLIMRSRRTESEQGSE